MILVLSSIGPTGASPGPWILSNLVQWYKGTSWFPGDTPDKGTFSVDFEGTSIAFVGNTPGDPASQSATVQIDGGSPHSINYADATPPSYKQWYQSPTLSDGKHTIKVSDMAGTSVDYAVLKVGPNTSLIGKTIVVDNDSPSIQYSGSWTRSTTKFNAGTLPDGFPFGNSTHRTSTAGDTIRFRFTGTSAAVYGIFSWFQLGILQASFTMDGNTLSQSYPVTTNSPSYTKGDGEMANFLLFSVDNLQAGDHTLVINVTQSNNQPFVFDYITYSPSFSTLSSMPIPNPAGSNSTSSSSPTSPTSSGGTVQGNSGGSSANGAGVARKPPVGAIAGAAVGGVVFLLALVAVIVMLRRRRRPTLDDNASHEAAVPYEGAYSDTTSGAGYMQQRLAPMRPQYETAPSNGTSSPFQTSDPQSQYGWADVKRERTESMPRPSDSIPRSTNSPSSGQLTFKTGAATGAEPPSYDALSTRHPSMRY